MGLTDEDLEELRESFDYNDGDANGRIDLDEFTSMLEDLEAEMGVDEARIGFHEIDTDGDGAIAFDEFVDWWRGR